MEIKLIFLTPRVGLKIKLAIHKVLIKGSANAMTDKMTKTDSYFADVSYSYWHGPRSSMALRH